LEAVYAETVSANDVTAVSIVLDYNLPGNNTSAELIVELQSTIDMSFIESVPAASPNPCQPSSKVIVMGA
jgi:hypothetical protein